MDFWQILCILLVQFVCTEAIFDAVALAKYSERTRLVRQAPNQIDLNSLCSVGCIAAFGNSLDSELEDMQQASGTINPQLFDEPKANKFCGAFRNSKRCNDQCEDSKLKRLLLAGLAPLDYLCVDHYAEFQALTPCFKKALPKVMEVCDSQCGGASAVSDLRDEAKAAQDQRDFDGMSDIMGKLCDLLRCRVECEKPIHDKVCGNKDAGYFMQDFAIVSMQGTEKMLMEAGAQAFYPATCRNFKADLNAAKTASIKPEKPNETYPDKEYVQNKNNNAAIRPAVFLTNVFMYSLVGFRVLLELYQIV